MKSSGKNLIQEKIDSILSGSLEEHEILDLLGHPAGLVRANALLALTRRVLINEDKVVRILLEIVSAPTGGINLIGSINESKLAILTLAWIQSDLAQSTYGKILSELEDLEREEIMKLAGEGPPF